MLKKQAKDTTRLQDKLQNCANKNKYLEKRLQHMSATALEPSESSITIKRGYVDFSSSQEQGLQKPPVEINSRF